MTPRPLELLSAQDLAVIVDRLGAQVCADHPGGVVLVGVLKGSVCLMADLLRRITVPCEVDFLALSAYSPGSARVQVLKDLDLDVTGRDVVLVEDVVDTGLSARYVLDLLVRHGARRTRLCALLDRPGRRILPLQVDYLGVEAPDDFLVGYGLDLAERFRNLSGVVSIGAAEPEDAAPLERLLYTS
ncbi:MAG TPA: phosphoribosyltransferase family protein [Acidimicrobiales bacterium]|nr:phosphoribosyltransferase family protein [Acidimicrobiales bacterium]